ncbi:MAG TPA: hypothetical protein VM325_17810 [Alphaproteobacteria bacterium]|nr:hypothetical protein [Alphaproteobacteria bacterium]
MTKPNEDWLVVVHRRDAKVGPVANDVRAMLHGVSGNVSFISWGNHKATNAYADVANVILAGTLYYRTSYYEALTRLAKGRKASDGIITKAERERTQMGEHRHLVLQALCRGAVRRCDGDKCHPMNAYVIASVRSGIRDALSDIFPGCLVEDWKPVPNELRGEAKKAFDHIKSWFDFSRPGERLTFRSVVKDTGINKSTFTRDVRRDDDYIEALAAEGIIEHGDGKYMTCYRRVG